MVPGAIARITPVVSKESVPMRTVKSPSSPGRAENTTAAVSPRLWVWDPSASTL